MQCTDKDPVVGDRRGGDATVPHVILGEDLHFLALLKHHQETVFPHHVDLPVAGNRGGIVIAKVVQPLLDPLDLTVDRIKAGRSGRVTIRYNYFRRVWG